MLELLGVPPSILAQHPFHVRTESYPPTLRDTLIFRQVWARLCSRTSESVTTDIAWNTVARAFFRWAARTGQRVLPDGVTRVDNNEIRTYLTLRRRWIRQYVDQLGLLKDVNWVRAEQSVTEDHLGLVVNGSLYCRDLDYLALKALLESNRWRPNLNHRVGYGLGYRDWWRWVKTSETGVTRVGFSAAGNARGIFWYSIMVPGHPFVPPGDTVQDFVLQDIWNPIVRTLRFQTRRRIPNF